MKTFLFQLIRWLYPSLETNGARVYSSMQHSNVATQTINNSVLIETDDAGPVEENDQHSLYHEYADEIYGYGGEDEREDDEYNEAYSGFAYEQIVSILDDGV